MAASLCAHASPLQNFGETIALLVNTFPTGGHYACWKPISHPGDLSQCPATSIIQENAWCPETTGPPPIASTGGWKQFRGPAFTFEARELLNERLDHAVPQNNMNPVSTWTLRVSSFLSLDRVWSYFVVFRTTG